MTFHDTLLDVSYSSDAIGGVEFRNVPVGAGEGGNVTIIAEAAEDYQSKWEIDFSQLMPARRKALRSFGILRKGMLRGFRFLAPDDRDIEDETVGVLNSGTGEIDLLNLTDGATTKFFIVKNYRDEFDSYLRWITHPSPLDDLTVEVLNSDGVTVAASGTFTGGYVAGKLPQVRVVNLTTFGNVTIYYRYGILEFAAAPAANKIIRVASGIYHHPVHFSSDWLKFAVDDGDLAQFKVGLEELLPISIGLYPSMTIPPPPDETAPGQTGNPSLVSKTHNTIIVSFTPATDDIAIGGYQYTLNNGASWNNFASLAGTSPVQGTITGLSPNTSYTIKTRAYDTATPTPNRGAASTNSVTVTTDTAPLTNYAAAANGGSVTDLLTGGAGTLSAVIDGLEHTNNSSFNLYSYIRTGSASLEFTLPSSVNLQKLVVVGLRNPSSYNTDPDLTETTPFALKDYEIFYWNGSSYLSLVSITNNDKVKREHTVSQTTNKLKLNVTATTDGTVYLVELKALA